MLKVKRMSNMNAGIGSTSRASTSNTAPGIASDPNSKLRARRRKSDKRTSAKSTLSISRQFLAKTEGVCPIVGFGSTFRAMCAGLRTKEIAQCTDQVRDAKFLEQYDDP